MEALLFLISVVHFVRTKENSLIGLFFVIPCQRRLLFTGETKKGLSCLVFTVVLSLKVISKLIYTVYSLSRFR